MEKFILNYRVIVEPDVRVGTNEKCFTAYCPTLGIADDGDTIDEALESIKEGIQCYVEALVEDGKEGIRSGVVKKFFAERSRSIALIEGNPSTGSGKKILCQILNAYQFSA